MGARLKRSLSIYKTGLLQKHALVEADIAIQADRVKAVTTNASKYSVSDNSEQRPLL